MAYATSNPPRQITSGPLFNSAGTNEGGGRLWWYASADAVTVVRVVGYFTNAAAPAANPLGMQVGDLVIVCDRDAVPITGSLCWVSAISATTGAADLSDGVTITGTNTD